MQVNAIGTQLRDPKLGTEPMAFGGFINGRRRGTREESRKDWQPFPVDPYSAICDDHTYIHTYILLTQCYYYRGTRLNTTKRIFFAAYDPI